MRWTEENKMVLFWLAIEGSNTKTPNFREISKSFPKINGQCLTQRAIRQKFGQIRKGVETRGVRGYFAGVCGQQTKPFSSTRRRNKPVLCNKQPSLQEQEYFMPAPSSPADVNDLAPRHKSADGFISDSDIDGETVTESEDEYDGLVYSQKDTRGVVIPATISASAVLPKGVKEELENQPRVTDPKNPPTRLPGVSGGFAPLQHEEAEFCDLATHNQPKQGTHDVQDHDYVYMIMSQALLGKFVEQHPNIFETTSAPPGLPAKAKQSSTDDVMVKISQSNAKMLLELYPEDFEQRPQDRTTPPPEGFEIMGPLDW